MVRKAVHPPATSSIAEAAPTSIRVLIADKNPLVRAGLRQLLGEDHRFGAVGQCDNGEEFLSAAADETFDVGIVGWVMSRGDGRFVLDHLASLDQPPRIIVYTGAVGEGVAAQAMAHGAAAYVTKSEAPGVLLDIAVSVAEGRMVFPFLDVRKIHDNPLGGLTRRELEVLSSLAAGKSNKEIAAEQGVAPNTVKFHLKNLYNKLGVRNRAQALSVYLRA